MTQGAIKTIYFSFGEKYRKRINTLFSCRGTWYNMLIFMAGSGQMAIHTMSACDHGIMFVLLGEKTVFPHKRCLFVKRIYMKNSKKCGIKIWAVTLAFIFGINANIPLLKASEHSETTVPSEESSDVLPITDQEMEAVVEIWNAEGLRAMAEDPFGTYLLAADVDMSGEAWTPFSFHGSLDGGGHSILNLTVDEIGTAVKETYDGNMKVYDTSFAGFFDEMEGAQVRDLNLVNLRIDVDTELPCFIGGITGYMANSSIENCAVQGILQLKAHDRMFGVGGIIGYGCGDVKDSKADVTLVCIDTDASTKDEQFMGGVCAAGYPNINGCDVAISGFDSDHGYVHNGGLVGMYMFYPKGTKYRGSITDNNVAGKITFFEDNKNRRAYCNGFIGEIMNWDFENRRNKDNFVRDEVFTYDVDLMPHACNNPVIQEEVTAPTCEFGYTTYFCETCGYRETDHYTLKVHDYEWMILKDATVEEEGLREGVCKICGETAQEIIPMAIPEPTDEPEQTSGDGSVSVGDGGIEGLDLAEDDANGGDLTGTKIPAGLIVTLVVLIICVAFVIGEIIRFRKI